MTLGSRTRSLFLGVLALLALVVPAGAQPEAGQPYSQDELDQLLAPVALYPDQLLVQVLMAATYPLEVVEAARFVQQNPGLAGEALDEALADRHWDPSVQSLAAFPQVLAMMNDNLEWMQRLGDAFLVDQQRVMDTVQSLRRRAEAAGNLQSTPQQSVSDQGGEIVIAPAEPDVVYVPVYDPFVIYGPWWAPAYPPWYWYPPPVYGYPVWPTVAVVIVFGRPWPVSHHHWGWAHPDWRGHHINLNVGDNRFWNRPTRPAPPPESPWQHIPVHRRGVAYPNAAVRDQYLRVDPNAVHARQNFRGYQLPPSAPGATRAVPNVPGPAPVTPRLAPNPTRPMPNVPEGPRATPPRPAAPTFDIGLSRQQTQLDAQRGMQSRQSIVPAPAQAAHPPSATPVPHGGAVRQR